MVTHEKEGNDTNNNFRSTLAQTLATLGICLLSVSVGFIMCMTTIVIGALRAENSTIPLSETEASWLGSLMFITQPIGSLSSGFSQDLLGRKLVLLMVNVPQVVAWLIIYFSTGVGYLYFAVVLFGLSLGFMEAPVLSYIGEATQSRLRGVLSCLACIFYNSGFMLETILGALFPWRTMVLWSAVVPVIGFFVILLLPESPAWLVTRGRVREAEASFQWLRGWAPREAVQQELEEMITYVKETQGTSRLYSGDYKPVATGEGECTTPDKPPSKFESVLEPGVLRAFRIVMIYFVIFSCASLFAMRPFFIEILDNLNLPIKSHYIVVICGAVQTLGAINMILVLKLMGKRGITFLSLGLCLFCCLGLGLYLVCDVNLPWLPVALFALSYYATSLGIMVVPWILTIELFPLRARGIASGACGAFAYGSLFLVTKTYYSLEAWLGVSGTCFLYGAVGVLGMVYLYLDMPETEGVPLEEIERRMSSRRPKRERVRVGES